MTTENEKIKIIRQKLKLTQQELADELGVSKQYLSKVENGYTNLSTERLTALCDRYNISMDWLLQDKGEMFLYIQKNKELLEQHEIYSATVTCLSSFIAYSNGVCDFLKQKYPNVLIEDVLQVAFSYFVRDCVKGDINYSAGQEYRKILLDKLNSDESFANEVLNKYYKTYVERLEKREKEID